ncbi:MAG: hypothetical protein A2X36_09350 [Elusimicrobia bacterium GWA2_69_24]|nr:MAG: hypothetical protein A2X36_09350 [Elusimicrobia bacterium GWA2_69_24]HBL15965.1 SAM-dependent methyltransferase [Elusimicrobiota bacterium]
MDRRRLAKISLGALAGLGLATAAVLDLAPVLRERLPLPRSIPAIMPESEGPWLDRPERAREEDPESMVRLMRLAPGMSVADVGAGTGYMTGILSRAVGPKGRVFATELQPGFLAALRRLASESSAKNISVVEGGETDPRLPPASCDVIFLVDTYHELARPAPFLQGLRAALRPGARLIVAEYRREDRSLPVEAAHRMFLRDIRAEIEREGFVFVEAPETLPRHHFVVFR